MTGSPFIGDDVARYFSSALCVNLRFLEGGKSMTKLLERTDGQYNLMMRIMSYVLLVITIQNISKYSTNIT